mgnify:CR=1 FL=1
MKKDKDCYVINPNWGMIAVLLFAIIVVMYCLENGLKSNLTRYNFSFLHILILGAALFVFGRQYVFHREGISVSVLGIPVQRIYWYDVREVYIVQRKKWGQSDDRIYVFCTDSPCTGADVEKMEEFSMYHPFDVLNIMIPDRQTDMCIHAIRQYCGESDVVVIRK